MFQFSTTTLVNSFDSTAKGAVVEGTLMRAAKGVTFFKKDVDNSCLTVTETPYKAESFDKLEVTIPTKDSGETDSNSYRLVMYVRSAGNADPVYGNQFVIKGRPFAVEFKGGVDSGDLEDLINKYLLLTYDVPLFTVTTDTGKITLTAVNGYQRIWDVRLQHWVAATTGVWSGVSDGYWKDTADVINFEDLTSAQVKTLETSNSISTAKITLTQGYEGKGTYEQILKDLRLPTGDNFAHLNVNRFEMPIPGGKYTQFTFVLEKDLKGYAGGIGINNPTKSITYHQVFVESHALVDFRKALYSGLGLSDATGATVLNQGVGDTTTAYDTTTSAKDTNANNVITATENK